MSFAEIILRPAAVIVLVALASLMAVSRAMLRWLRALSG